MFIKKENIVIRNVEIYDAPVICKWWNDGKVMAHAGFSNGLYTNENEVIDQIISFGNSDNSEFAIIEIDGIKVGELSYSVKNAIAYPGFKICEKAYQNMGYGPKVILIVFDYIFRKEKYSLMGGIKEIIWDTNLRNKRAMHVYESKIGATRLRINKDSWEDDLGVLQSSVEYSISKDEFYNKHKNTLKVLEENTKKEEVISKDIENIEERLEIRRITEEDLLEIYNYIFVEKHNDSNLFDGPYFKDEEITFNSIEEFLKHKNTDFYRKKDVEGIYIDNKFIGVVTRYFEDKVTLWLKIGISIYDKQYWSSSIGYHALIMWITKTFNEYKQVESIGLTTWNGNFRMIKCAKKLGLKKEAEFRKVRFYKNYYFNSVSYGVLREEWFNNK